MVVASAPRRAALRESDVVASHARVLATEHSRARFASAALIVNALFYGAQLVLVAWHVIDAAVFASGAVPGQDPALIYEEMAVFNLISHALLVVGAVAFLPWLSAAFRAAHALGAAPEGVRARDAQHSFFIPALNLYLPYRAMRALDTSIDPDRVPPVLPRADPEASSASYREPAVVPPIALVRVRRTPLAWWWAFWVSPVLFWVVRTTSSETWLHAMLAEIASYACSAAAALLAVVVVSRMDARLVELARRVGAHAAATL